MHHHGEIPASEVPASACLYSSLPTMLCSMVASEWLASHLRLHAT